MKTLISLIALILVTACGKSIHDPAQEAPSQRHGKSHLSQAETWSILSNRLLPLKVKVVINDLEFINECTGLGRAVIERTKTNGAIHISSSQAFRQEYFAIDIFDCEDSSKFFSGVYIDQQVIEHPVTGAITIVLRLRN